MRPHSTSRWLWRIAVFVLLSLSTASAALAQTPQVARASLEAALVPGMTVWITDAGGQELKVRVVDVSNGIVTATMGEDTRRFPTSEIARIRARRSDAVLNGALIGAGTGVVSGLMLCRLAEPWE